MSALQRAFLYAVRIPAFYVLSLRLKLCIRLQGNISYICIKRGLSCFSYVDVPKWAGERVIERALALRLSCPVAFQNKMLYSCIYLHSMDPYMATKAVDIETANVNKTSHVNNIITN
jgi:hypothetical protein